MPSRRSTGGSLRRGRNASHRAQRHRMQRERIAFFHDNHARMHATDVSSEGNFAFHLAAEGELRSYEHEWASSLVCGFCSSCQDACECLSVSGCCLGCYYCQLNRIADRLMDDASPAGAEISGCGSVCCLTLLMDCLLSGALFSMTVRQGVASRYQIKGETCCSAWCKSCFCPSCSVSQMLRELRHRDESVGSWCCCCGDDPKPASMGGVVRDDNDADDYYDDDNNSGDPPDFGGGDEQIAAPTAQNPMQGIPVRDAVFAAAVMPVEAITYPAATSYPMAQPVFEENS